MTFRCFLKCSPSTLLKKNNPGGLILTDACLYYEKKPNSFLGSSLSLSNSEVANQKDTEYPGKLSKWSSTGNNFIIVNMP